MMHVPRALCSKFKTSPAHACTLSFGLWLDKILKRMCSYLLCVIMLSIMLMTRLRHACCAGKRISNSEQVDKPSRRKGLTLKKRASGEHTPTGDENEDGNAPARSRRRLLDMESD